MQAPAPLSAAEQLQEAMHALTLERRTPDAIQAAITASAAGLSALAQDPPSAELLAGMASLEGALESEAALAELIAAPAGLHGLMQKTGLPRVASYA